MILILCILIGIIIGCAGNLINSSISCTEIVSILIAALAFGVSIVSLWVQRMHNHQSVHPIIDVIIGDYDDDIYVKLINNGIGPATIEKLECFYEGSAPINNKCSSALYKLLTEEKAHTFKVKEFSDFVEDITGRSLSPNREIILIELKNGTDTENDVMRLMLKDVRIVVKFHDMYKSSSRTERKLDFFGRHYI